MATEEERIAALKEFAEKDYKAVWDSLGFIEDQGARVRAANEVFVHSEKYGVYAAKATGVAAPALGPAPEGAYDQPKKRDFKGYNAAEKKWDFCPTCGKTDVWRQGKSGKWYGSCCGFWLNGNGTMSEKKDKGGF